MRCRQHLITLTRRKSRKLIFIFIFIFLLIVLHLYVNFYVHVQVHVVSRNIFTYIQHGHVARTAAWSYCQDIPCTAQTSKLDMLDMQQRCCQTETICQLQLKLLLSSALNTVGKLHQVLSKQMVFFFKILKHAQRSRSLQYLFRPMHKFRPPFNRSAKLTKLPDYCKISSG